jgi:hypothetical protein
MSDSGGRNLSQKFETFSGYTENDYLCLLIKLLLKVQNCVGIRKSNFMQIHFQVFVAFYVVFFLGGGECLRGEFDLRALFIRLKCVFHHWLPNMPS